MATDLFHLAAVAIGSNVITQITDGNVSDKVQEFLADDSVSVYARGAAIDFEDLRISATSEAVKTVLAAISLLGTEIKSGTTCIAYFAKRVSGQAISTTGVSLTFGLGLAYLQSIDGGGEGQLANVGFEIVGVSSDGTSSPITKNAAAVIPTTSTKEMYVVGGVGVMSFSAEMGINVDAKRIGNANTFVNHASVEKCHPRVTLSKNEIGDFAATSLSSVQLVDCVDGAGRGTSPITITFNQELAYLGGISGKPAASQYQSILTFDGTNAPMTFEGIS